MAKAGTAVGRRVSSSLSNSNGFVRQMSDERVARAGRVVERLRRTARHRIERAQSAQKSLSSAVLAVAGRLSTLWSAGVPINRPSGRGLVPLTAGYAMHDVRSNHSS